MRSLLGLLVGLGICMLMPSAAAEAGTLTYVSDLIGSSQAATSTNHAISFTTTSSVPASGKIVISNETTGIQFPGSLDYTDIDLRVDSGSGFVQRVLGPTPTATEDGVSVVSGTTGSLTITLNSFTGIGVGDDVQILIGNNATSGATGDVQLVNPSSLGSYRVVIQTKTAADAVVDEGKAMIAILDPVTVSGVTVITAPIRFNGLPSGDIASGHDLIEVSLQTVDAASCRFATTTGIAYASMTNQFSPSLGTLHSIVIGNHQDATTYTYYVRCMDGGGDENDDDYAITYSLKTTATSTTSQASGTGSGGQGGVGPFFGGSNVLYLSGISFSGTTAPRSTVIVAKDGKAVGTVNANDAGSFGGSISNLERGTYTVMLYSLDRENRKSSSVTNIVSVVSGTNNVLTNIVIPPTISVSKESVGLAENFEIRGEAIPGSSIEVFAARQTGTGKVGDVKRFSAIALRAGEGDPGGGWQVDVPGLTLARGTYQIKARMKTPAGIESGYSATVFLGVGEAASPDLSERADTNGDGKVNLVDFSIMLTSWGTANPDSDLNGDGIVNLADFSILLFNWTG